MQQTFHGDCTELTPFVCEHFSVCLHDSFSQEALCCIHHPHRKHDQLFLRPLLKFLSGQIVQVFPFFASVLLQIELNTLKFQSIQNNTFVIKNQEAKSIFAFFLYMKR